MGRDLYGVTVPAAEQPVTLAEAKAWCKVTHTNDDDLITGLIVAATLRAEMYTNRVFVSRTFTGKFECLELSDYEKGPFFQVRRAPLISLTFIKVYVDDVLTTISSDDYNLKQTSGFSRIIFEEINDSPDLIPYPYEISFTAGYGEDGDVPELIKVAIKDAVAYWYQNRGDCGDLPKMSKMNLRSFKILNTYG